MKSEYYDVTITETLEKVVKVKASSESEAINEVKEKYDTYQLILDADNFTGVEFKAERSEQC